MKMNRIRPARRLAYTAPIAFLILVSTLPFTSATATNSNPSVTEISMSVQGRLLEVFRDVPATLIVQLEPYKDQDTISVVLTITVATPDHPLHYLFFCGLDSPIITASSATATNPGFQKDQKWTYYGKGTYCLTARGELKVDMVAQSPGRIFKIGDLSYGDTSYVTPIFEISAYLEDPMDIDSTIRLKANATITKLSLEISTTPDYIDTAPFQGELWEARANYAEKRYEIAYTIAEDALQLLRTAKAQGTDSADRSVAEVQALLQPLVGFFEVRGGLSFHLSFCCPSCGLDAKTAEGNWISVLEDIDMAKERQYEAIRAYRAPKGTTIRRTETSPPMEQGVVFREPISSLYLLPGTYAERQGIRAMTSFDNIGLAPRISWAFLLSENADSDEVDLALTKYGISRWSWNELRRIWEGNNQGYMIPEVHRAFPISVANHGMAKNLSEMLAIADQPEVQARIRGWGQLCFPCSDRVVEYLILYGTHSGGTCFPGTLMLRSEMAYRRAIVKRAIMQLYVETQKPQSYVQENQRLLFAHTLATNARGYHIIIMAEDTFIAPTSEMDDPTDPDIYTLNREELDTISSKIICALTGHAKILSRHVDEEPSDTYGSMSTNSTTKVMGVCATRFAIPYLEKSWKRKATDKLLRRDNGKVVDRVALESEITKHASMMIENPFDFRVTDVDISVERKSITIDPNYLIFGGCGLTGRVIDHELIQRACHKVGLHKRTHWVPLGYLYSNSRYCYLALVFHVRGRLPALEKIFDTSTPPRRVKSFRSLIPPKDYRSYASDAKRYVEAFASKRNLHPSKLWDILIDPMTLKDALQREPYYQAPKGSLDMSPFDWWKSGL